MNITCTNTPSYIGYEMKIEELAEKYINNEILKCDSLLVSNLMKKNYDDICHLVSQFGIYNIMNDCDTSIEAIEEFLTYNCETEDWQELPFDEKGKLAYYLGFDPQTHEIYEWWAVTSWLADKLEEFDQPVLRNDYGDWWGRTCTGQAIILDGIMQKIAESNF